VDGAPTFSWQLDHEPPPLPGKTLMPFRAAQPEEPKDPEQEKFGSVCGFPATGGFCAQEVRGRTVANATGRPIKAARLRKARRCFTTETSVSGRSPFERPLSAISKFPPPNDHT